MTMYEETMAKIQQLPESLVEEVRDFVDFLLVRNDNARWQRWTQFSEGLDPAESDFSDYLRNLEDYEDRLACGEIRWQ